jgi:hypothetical protein
LKERYKEADNLTEFNNKQQHTIRTKTPPYTSKARSCTHMPSAEPPVKQEKGNQGMKLHKLSSLFHASYFPHRQWFFPSRCDGHWPEADGFFFILSRSSPAGR